METVVEQGARPRPVVLLEAIGILGAVSAMVLSRGESAFTGLFDLLLQVGLTLWVTRGRSRVGRVVYTGILLFGATALAGVYLWDSIPADLAPMLVLVVFLELTIFLTLLWWPSTSEWLKGAYRRV